MTMRRWGKWFAVLCVGSLMLGVLTFTTLVWQVAADGTVVDTMIVDGAEPTSVPEDSSDAMTDATPAPDDISSGKIHSTATFVPDGLDDSNTDAGDTTAPVTRGIIGQLGGG